MGVAENIAADTFPKQGRYLGTDVRVCFNYDTSRVISGRVVRDDTEEPGRMIIRLTDGRYVLSTECMWTPGGAE